MAGPVDAVAVLQLTTLLAKAERLAREALREPTVGSAAHAPPLQIALFGLLDSGKTTLARALVTPEAFEFDGVKERPGPDTLVPIEYRYAQVRSVRVRVSDRLGKSSWLRKEIPAHGRVDLDRVIRSSGCERVQVMLPSPLLAEWNIALLDLPSLSGDRDRDDRIIKQIEDGWVVLYILHARGISDGDLDVLQRLRPRTVLLLVNIYENELVPSRSAVSLIKDIEAPGRLSLGFATPLIITALDREDSSERTMLALLLAHLGWTSHQQELRAVQQALDQLDRRLVEHATLMRQNISSSARSTNLQHQIEGVAALLEMDNWFEHKAVAANAAILCSRETLQSAGHLTEKVLLGQAEKLVATYNFVAGARGSARKETNGGTTFAKDFVELREVMRGFLLNIGKAKGELNLSDSECSSLRQLDLEIADGRVELALLGTFSSGKSSVINALLGVENSDHSPKLLRTSVQPETSTVNRLEYASSFQLLGIDWHESVELVFLKLQSEARVCYRVHEQEINSFHLWLQEDIVRLEDCEFTIESNDGQFAHTRVDPGQSFEATRRAVRNGQGFHRFIYPAGSQLSPNLGRDAVTTSVQVRRFSKQPPQLKGLPHDIQGELRHRPDLALRIRQLRIGYPHTLLQHATIIDTPGTDSHIPHHRQVARSFVHDRRCPVLYCFLGNQAAGNEDKDNIKTAREWGIGRSDENRFFFTITCKGRVLAKDHSEVRQHVKDKLTEMGVKTPMPYFIEAVPHPDEEFCKLEREISTYVMGKESPRLQAWINRLRRQSTQVKKVCI